MVSRMLFAQLKRPECSIMIRDGGSHLSSPSDGGVLKLNKLGGFNGGAIVM